MLYDAILIDADDTLFDFRGAEKNAIGAIIQQLGHHGRGRAAGLPPPQQGLLGGLRARGK